MAVTKVLARLLLFEVETETPASFVEVKGLNQIGWSPTTNRADTTDFNDAGSLAHIPASRGTTFALDGFRLEDESGGDRDPGQARMEVLAELFGADGLGNFRVTSQGGEVKTFAGSVEVTPNGGGNDDPGAWSCSVEVSGPIGTA